MKTKFLAILILAMAFTAGACNRGGNNNTNSGTPVSTPTATPLAANTDPALKTNIENALKAKGFTNVTVDVSTTPITIRGTVPKGRTAEMVQTVNLANDMKPVRNQTTEE